MQENSFTFEISLSVLNHLGRSLYRSFTTILGEAVSNSWDADAQNVWIYIDRDDGNFTIKDDGDGMTADDFQNKFLRIGYSKRKDGNNESPGGRPFIGRKGIGKLALLSCAEKVVVITKTQDSEYVGGTIDNSRLDEAITEDLTPQEYLLEGAVQGGFSKFIENHEKGTIIKFENIHSGIRNRIDFLRKMIAMYFRFSLVDKTFKIHVNGAEITATELKDVAERTEFLWIIKESEDPYVEGLRTSVKDIGNPVKISINAHGFVASVEKPRDLKILGADEKMSIDLFVNGRLRQKDILTEISHARIAENYLYGQIHLDDLDDEKDRFTSNREGILPDDPKFKKFLDEIKPKLLGIIENWDELRDRQKEPGDPENMRITKKKRKSLELSRLVAEDYKTSGGGWSNDSVDEFADAATDNHLSYFECFIAENLVRELISRQGINVPNEIKSVATRFKDRENSNKEDGNVSIQIRRTVDDLSYLDLKDLAKIADKTDTENNLLKSAKIYKPIRDALMHTSLLTDEAKTMLSATYANIKGRILKLLEDSNSD